MRIIPIIVFVSSYLIQSIVSISSDAIKEADIKSLTLNYGKMTTGRRIDPIPQLKCIGGSAGCKAFVPRVVQCHNKWSDGVSVRWECTADNMNKAFKFGKIKMICEGYSRPGDPYILKGSCGLEYTIDLTKEGLRNQDIKKPSYNAIPLDAIKEADIKTLQLYNGKKTTGRRNDPIPQLKCVGGSAGCSAFIPQVVQCNNKGPYGESAQWECKTEMDGNLKFGKVKVLCEGYGYPEDPYVLKGSCGLEYTIDLTKKGLLLNQESRQPNNNKISQDAIKEADIKLLTLNYGKMTTGRRNIPIPQMKCVGGTAGCTSFIPQVIQCENKRSDGVSVQWECNAEKSNVFELGTTKVQCEGYAYRKDPYVLKGSCGVEYTVNLKKGNSQNQVTINQPNNNNISPDAIKEADIKTLTLNYGKMTTSRKKAHIPQLKCVGGSAGCKAFIPQVVQCENKRSDGVGVQWECNAEKNNVFELGETRVQCEGYAYPEDPYVLKGSCGVEYTVNLKKENIQSQDIKQPNYRPNTVSQDAIKEADIKQLTFNHGKMTTGRRNASIPQMKCVIGGTAGCTSFIPQVIQCENKRSDGVSVQWECNVEKNNVFELGKTKVQCEGYAYREDPYILKGSCGVEYTVNLKKGSIHPFIDQTSEGIKQPTYNNIFQDAIKKTDIKTLTLNYGKMTTSRKNAFIPQLKCVGGSAGCNAVKPQVVRCEKKGSHGVQVLWECKTSMDKAYKFGKIKVQCEGYGYPEDPYVLKGSCGLEYTIDLTKEGLQNQHNYYGNNNGVAKPTNSNVLIVLLVCGIPVCIFVIGALLCCCCKECGDSSKTSKQLYQSSTTNYNIRGSSSDNPPPYNPTAPPPPPPPQLPPPYSPEYRNEFTYRTEVPSYQSSSDGFWTGAAAGGAIGYILGNRNNSGNGYHSRPNHSTGSQPSSTGTRTVTGFGGTIRR